MNKGIGEKVFIFHSMKIKIKMKMKMIHK